MSDKGIKTIKCGDEPSFFAAANSGDGFKSFYGEIFGGAERRYLIKGGPGTGKSTLMRRLAEAARKNAHSVEYYRCSSDPSSLDGLIIAGRVAIIDATSPHCVEPELAGARDEMIDLGAFWDAEALAAQKEEIEYLSKAKRECYGEAYGYLHAAKDVKKAFFEANKGYFDKKKLERYAKRLLTSIPRGEKYASRTGLCAAIGMTGRAYLDTYARGAERVYAVKDFGAYSGELFCLLAEGAKKRKNALKVSYDPLVSERVDALLFEDAKVAFVLDRDADECKYDKYIYMKRFFKIPRGELSEVRRRSVECEDVCESLLEEAQKSLLRAGKYHFELERIYKKCMDFDSLERFSHSLCEKIIRAI